MNKNSKNDTVALKGYVKPELENYGTLEEYTNTGPTGAGADMGSS